MGTVKSGQYLLSTKIHHAPESSVLISSLVVDVSCWTV